MPVYINLINYTDQGLRNIKKSANRADGARQMAEELGGEVRQFYLTMGNYDIVAITEFPDDAAAATFVSASARLETSKRQRLRHSKRTHFG